MKSRYIYIYIYIYIYAVWRFSLSLFFKHFYSAVSVCLIFDQSLISSLYTISCFSILSRYLLFLFLLSFPSCKLASPLFLLSFFPTHLIRGKSLFASRGRNLFFFHQTEVSVYCIQNKMKEEEKNVDFKGA